ncbi:hypothetical protein PV762_11790 [Mitsuaria sp. CC2]|uniref:hypothetical protein n=1 Tax=Mitsuaria sp. CC2 TaxID=3029186 RepID=UPI003B8D9482
MADVYLATHLGTLAASEWFPEDIMRDLSLVLKALISIAAGAIGAGLSALNGFSPAAIAAIAGLFVLLFWTWLRR